jgi:hypothetical protein
MSYQKKIFFDKDQVYFIREIFRNVFNVIDFSLAKLEQGNCNKEENDLLNEIVEMVEEPSSGNPRDHSRKNYNKEENDLLNEILDMLEEPSSENPRDHSRKNYNKEENDLLNEVVDMLEEPSSEGSIMRNNIEIAFNYNNNVSNKITDLIGKPSTETKSNLPKIEGENLIFQN